MVMWSTTEHSAQSAYARIYSAVTVISKIPITIRIQVFLFVCARQWITFSNHCADAIAEWKSPSCEIRKLVINASLSRVWRKTYFKLRNNKMADSTIATKDVENWIRNEFLPQSMDSIWERKLGVQSGGEIEYDAVSEDGKIVCVISTSSGQTAEENRTWMFWRKSGRNLLGRLAQWETRDHRACIYRKSMGELLKQEKLKDRLPKQIKMLFVKLPQSFRRSDVVLFLLSWHKRNNEEKVKTYE